jgi:ABC-2 type transport system permease protein
MTRNDFGSTALSVAGRNFKTTMTSPGLALRPILGPLVFFAAFGGGLSAVGQAPGFDFPSGYTAFQFAFIMLQGALFVGLFCGLALARDLQSGFIRRLMLAAGDRRGIVAGYLLAGLGVSVIATTVLLAVALVCGMQLDGGALDVAGLYSLALVICSAGALWSMGVALRMRTVQAAPLMQTPGFLGLFLAPAFVPYALLEGWIRPVAAVNPITQLVEAARGFVSGQPEDLWLAYGVAAALLALLAAWSVTGLRRAERAGG